MSEKFDQEPESRSLYYVIPSEIMDSDLSNTHKLLYALLSGLAHRNKECYPSDKYLSERLKISIDHAGRIVNQLAKMGYITKKNIPHPQNPFKKVRIITIHTEFKKCLSTGKNADLEAYKNAESRTGKNAEEVSEGNSNKESTLKGTKESARKSRAPHVSSSFSEHENLVKDFGEELVQRAYEKLSEWKIDTPKSKWKKNDHLAIRRWVIEALREEDIKAEKASRRPENAIKEVQEYLKSHSRKEGLKRALKSMKVEIGPHWIDFKEFPRDGYIDFTSKNAKVLIDHFINKMNL